MNHLLHKTLVKPYDLESPLQKEKENGWLAFNISFSLHIGLTPEKSWKVSRCVVYRFWQGLCISRALCLTFPAVEPITLQLTTAACCDQKEQLLSPHGGNSMRVPDGGGGRKTWSTNQTHLCARGYKFTLLYCASGRRKRGPWPGLREALAVCES